MPDDNDLTSAGETGTPLTSEPETGAESGAVTPDVPDAAPVSSPPEVDYRQKFAASTKEAQRLSQELAQTRQQMTQMQSYVAQMQAQQQYIQQQSAPKPISDEEIFGELADGVLEREPNKIRKALNHVKSLAKQEVVQDLTQEGTRRQRVAASMQYVNAELADGKSMLTQQSLTRYQQMLADPSYSWIERDTENVGGTVVFPHLLRQAVLETKASMAGQLESARKSIPDLQENFVEPSRPAPPAANGGKTFVPQKHLSETERRLCQVRNMSYNDYWKYMNPDLKEARLKAGKALSSREAGVELVKRDK